VREIVQREIVLRKRMQDRGVPEPLLNIGFHPVQEVIDNPRETGITYRELMWVKELFRELEVLHLNHLKYPYERRFHKVLRYLNLNTYEFVDYYEEEFRKLKETEPGNELRLLRLKEELRRVRNFRSKPAFAYRAEKESVKEQVEGWLVREIEYLEQLPPQGRPDQYTTDMGDEPPKFDLPTTQAGLFIRLCYEFKVMDFISAKATGRFFSKLFRQKNGQPINENGFMNNYYAQQPDKATLESLVTILEAMTKELKARLEGRTTIKVARVEERKRPIRI
jgi:hypothetical protein